MRRSIEPRTCAAAALAALLAAACGRGEGGGAPVSTGYDSSSPAATQPGEAADRVRFDATSLSGSDVAGAIHVDGQAVTFEGRLGRHGASRVEYQDDAGHRVVALVRADGTRGVEVDGARVTVGADGAVPRDAFSGLPAPTRAALGLVPLDLACARSGAEDRLAEAMALPFNLLQRAEPGALTPRALLGAATCGGAVTQADARSAARTRPSDDLLRSAKLVVAGAPKKRSGT